jgi:hypothetical protein
MARCRWGGRVIKNYCLAMFIQPDIEGSTGGLYHGWEGYEQLNLCELVEGL